MRVEDRDETDDDAGDGQQVEHGVKQLVPDPTAAATRSVEQHRWKERKIFFRFYILKQFDIWYWYFFEDYYFFFFEKLTLSGEVDEPDDHEDGVEVELLSRVLLPAIDNIGYW